MIMKHVYRSLDFLRRRPEWLWLPILVLVFFLMTSAYNYFTQSANFVKWTSPDESANYYLAKLYSEQTTLMSLEKYNVLAQGIIMPRSLRTDGAWLKPVSFLGMPLIYGTIAKVLGVGVLPYITPALAALGLLFFYLLINRVFGRQVAMLATVLLAVFPVYIYFSSHSFFHNIPFVVFLVASLYLVIKMTDYPDFSRNEAHEAYRGWLLAALAGIFCGLAVATRTSELLWLLPLFGILWMFNWHRAGLIKVLFFLFFAVMAYSPVLYWNTILYGAPFTSGYPGMDKSINAIISTGKAAVNTVAATPVAPVATPTATIAQNRVEPEDYLAKLNSAIFVFGFKPIHSFTMFYYYLWVMFPWLIVLAVVAVALWFVNWRRRQYGQLIYLLGLLVIGPILVFYYGSWIFYDNPDPNSFTIGNSYTRYWLPIYLGLIPLAAYAIHRLAIIGWRPLLRQAFSWSAVVLISGFSLLFVAFGSDEGLVYGAYRQIASQVEWARVLELTEPKSIIVTRYHDKLFFPDRRVIVGLLTDVNMNRIYGQLARKVPVYYYNFNLNAKDLAYLNDRRLAEPDLIIQEVAKVTDKFSLYRLKSRTANPLPYEIK
jgi:4-amino-4-deoxy-L-arabinose transferase-like glycosyltransferase